MSKDASVFHCLSATSLVSLGRGCCRSSCTFKLIFECMVGSVVKVDMIMLVRKHDLCMRRFYLGMKKGYCSLILSGVFTDDVYCVYI